MVLYNWKIYMYIVCVYVCGAIWKFHLTYFYFQFSWHVTKEQFLQVEVFIPTTVQYFLPDHLNAVVYSIPALYCATMHCFKTRFGVSIKFCCNHKNCLKRSKITVRQMRVTLKIEVSTFPWIWRNKNILQ